MSIIRLSTPFSGPVSRSLHRQITLRMIGLGLVAILLLLSVGHLSYHFLTNRDIELRREQLQAHYAKLLPRRHQAHLNEAQQLASRLEFTHILEQQDRSRWTELTSMLSAQWVFNKFSNLIILGSDGRALFRHGPESAELQANADTAHDWLFSDPHHLLFRVYRVPLWLGQEGQGELVLFHPMTDSSLKELTIPQTDLQLRFQGQVLAASRQDMDSGFQDPDRYLRLDIPLGETHPHNGSVPVLQAYRDLSDILPYLQFVMRPVLVSLVIILLVWFGLGRWIKSTAQRIEVLGQGAKLYAEGGDQAMLQSSLVRALDSDDEIGQTAEAFQDMLRSLEERSKEQQSYLKTLALLEEAVIEFDPQGRIQHASPGWARLYGESEPAQVFYDAIHPEDEPTLRTLVDQLLACEKSQVTLRVRLRSALEQASEFWVEVRLLGCEGRDGEPCSIRGVLRDITQSYQHERQITHMALHDALTELPNRILLEDRLKIALRLCKRNRQFLAICFIDVDHFKVVNDSLGHKAGDQLLVGFAQRLRQHIRSCDTLARWGGDEFVLLLPEMEQFADIRRVTDKICSAMQTPIDLNGEEVRVTFSMGAAVYPVDAEDMETLCSQADRAMFHAKGQGRNQVRFFHDMGSNGSGKEQLVIQNRLAAAIDGGLIQPWFQPIVDARTQQCTSLEALARWKDDEHGWISPATFISLAENLGLIGELGNQIMLASLDALVEICQRGYALAIAVNISRRQLIDTGFSDWLLGQVHQRGLKPDQVVLEITESVAADGIERGSEQIQRLRQAGFQIAIDDFGTGYSSLSQVHEMHAVELKIDISFVRRLCDPAGRSMVQAIVSMSQALGMKTVAEGVENEQAALQLAEMGVNCLQGYLFAKPMPLDDVKTWLDDNSQQPDPYLAAPR